jgi:integrase/recombinase XerD
MLKESDVAKYSKTYKCCVTHTTPKAIESLHRQFKGVALVDARYLNRPKRLRTALGKVVTSGSLQSELLKKLLELSVIRLQPLDDVTGGGASMALQYLEDK